MRTVILFASLLLIAGCGFDPEPQPAQNVAIDPGHDQPADECPRSDGTPCR